jgi:hypothetical protein
MKKYLYYLIILSLVLLPLVYVINIFSLLDWRSYRMFYQIFNNDAEIVMFGNSVNFATSDCDNDKSSISEFLSRELEKKVLDISEGGMTVAEYLDLTKILLHQETLKTVIIPIPVGLGIDDLLDRNKGKLIIRGILLSVLSGYPVNHSISMDDFVYTPQTWSYKGVTYGSMDDINNKYLSKEKALSNCTDKPWSNKRFVEFIHWRNYGSLPEKIDGDHFVEMISIIKKKDIYPLIYIPPMNIELMEELNDESVVIKVNEHLDRLRTFFDNNGIEYVDLSDALGKTAYIDSYCACGHLSEVGRRFVANKLGKEIMKIRAIRNP